MPISPISPVALLTLIALMVFLALTAFASMKSTTINVNNEIRILNRSKSHFILLAMLFSLLFLSSCSPSAERSGEVSISIPTGEAEEIEPSSREIVSSYENLKGNAKEPKPECRVVNIKNISPDKVVETISRAIPNIIAVKSDGSNSIIIRGEPDDINEAQKIIVVLDKKIPQILIEGKVVEVSQSGLSDIGIIWGREQGSFKFSIDKSTGGISQSDNILGVVNALVASGKASILANPKITALDGKEAEINIGSRIPYAVPAGTTSTSPQWTIQYIDAGVNLKILPTVASDGTIVSTIRPEVSNISEWRTTSAGEFPVISTRNASVTVRIRDGETLVIGGLLNESDRENMSKIAGFSEIPLIGALFQRKVTEKTKTDVLFLITPHIME
jgi:type II secretory pathway component GspD/PulD (secretin)